MEGEECMLDEILEKYDKLPPIQNQSELMWKLLALKAIATAKEIELNCKYSDNRVD